MNMDNRLRVLVACEYSGKVREAFRRLGHDAWSCDLLPADDGSPYHIQGDVLPVLGQDRWKIRSETFQGIADAMAQQWGK